MIGECVVTRIGNACVLLQFGETAVLTDPWFRPHWMFTERPGLMPSQLPRLSAIVGSHSVPDHWNVEALAERRERAAIPVFAATERMVSKARKFGFSRAEQVPWGARRPISEDVEIEVIAGQRAFGMTVNNYVFTTVSGLRVFFGGETRDLAPLRRYGEGHAPVDVYIGPVNGVRFVGRKLVTSAVEAVEAAKMLGARVIVPIHDRQRSLLPLTWAGSDASDVERAAAGSGVRVHRLPAGERLLYSRVGQENSIARSAGDGP